MKKTGMAKSDAKKLMGKMVAPGAAGIGNAGNAANAAVDKREQRKRDQALGLVPFAVKLNGDLVKRLHALATERGLDLNETVADVLAKGLAA
ncbi:hypothetical protein [Undibacterium terreum]|uniref:Uncharacterized protein n=1 Tax=Undibacterium terreum TaxID=1224302 RepID=A0A916UAC9_9BURK|nr:hypothetical protein [Undibacterium terreum]GGC65283.1 hypothetical protein GCM10011396_10340 [Undibacterium terreum]